MLLSLFDDTGPFELMRPIRRSRVQLQDVIEDARVLCHLVPAAGAHPALDAMDWAAGVISVERGTQAPRTKRGTRRKPVS